MFEPRSFENSINVFTLRFHDPACEQRFQDNRLNYVNCPPMTKRMIVAIGVFGSLLMVAESVRITLSCEDAKDIRDQYVMHLLFCCALGFEYVISGSAYWGFLRGTVATVVCHGICFYSSYNDYHNVLAYPVTDVW
jgi:hypothetical protein